MEALIAYIGATVPTFMLVLARAVGLQIQAPILSNKNLPAPVRMTISIALSLVVMMQMTSYPAIPTAMLSFVILLLTEFMFGALFGFAASFLFHAFQSAGELSGVQSGMSFASTMNPLLKSNVNPIGTLYYNIALVLFLLIGGHLWLIGGFVQSYKLVPLATFMLTPAVGEYFIQISGTFLAITVQLALPAIIVLFMTDLGVGYINKAAPQASNILELVQAVKPIAGLTVVMLLFPNLMSMTHQLTENMVRDLDMLLRLSGQ